VSLGSITLRTPVPVLDDGTLTTAERALTRFIGPMAKLIVRKAAAQARDRAELCLLLAESIDDPELRSRFVETFTKGGSEPPRPGTSSPGKRRRSGIATHQSSPGSPITRTPDAPVDPAFVAQVAARLAVYLGPIARIVAKNAAQKANSREEFVALVADNLGTQDRAAFLVEMRHCDR
jgi:serine/threonine-protein kinase